MTRHKPTKNVLFISADQWRAECLSLLGHQVQTPHLDQLAAEGALFRQHYTQVAPCGPARTSLHTGMYAMNHRSILNGTPLAAHHTNVALEVRQAGYDPILYGYTDTSPDPRSTGLSRQEPAFRDYGGIMPGYREGMRFDHDIPLAWYAHLKRQGYDLPAPGLGIYNPDPEFVLPPGRGHSFAPPRYRAEDSDTAYTADRVIDYLESHPEGGWFVHAVFLRPHPPLYACEPYNSLYDPAQIDLPRRTGTPDSTWQQHPFLRYWGNSQRQPDYYTGHPLNVVDLPESEVRQLRATYYGLITEVDHHIGRLVEYLKATGQYDNTLIIFTVDHGEQLGDQWLWGKGGYFDASYHIPLIIRAPGLASGLQIEAFTEAIDLMPTILHWLALPIPITCDGHSLLPWLRGTSPESWRTAVHWEFDFRDPRHQAAEKALGLASSACALNVWRDRDYKLVHFTDLPPLLFDLNSDPDETTNLAVQPPYREQLLTMTQQLLSHRLRYSDRSLTQMLITRDGLLAPPPRTE